jgi:hypothetical protein
MRNSGCAEVGKRLVVVENAALMAEHQRELIEELQGQRCLLEDVRRSW